MKSSMHNLIPLLPLFLITFDYRLSQFYPATANSGTRVSSPESESHCDWRSVSLSVFVSSPVRGSWPDISYCLTVTVLSLGGRPLWREGGLSFVRVQFSSTELFSIIMLHGRTENTVSNNTPIVVCLSIRRLETGSSIINVTSQLTWRVPLLRVYGPLPSNGCFSASTALAFSKYATIWTRPVFSFSIWCTPSQKELFHLYAHVYNIRFNPLSHFAFERVAISGFYVSG
jgi:hypothetical protein